MISETNQKRGSTSIGNLEYLEGLVKIYHQQLIVSAASIVGDLYAEEIVQDVWELLSSGEVNLYDIHSIRHWLHKVVINKALNRYKRESRSVSLELMNSEELGIIKIKHLDNYNIYEASPEAILVATQKAIKLMTLWDSLPDIQKRALELRYFSDNSYRDIALELNMTVSNAKVTIHRVRSKLMEQLEARK